MTDITPAPDTCSRCGSLFTCRANSTITCDCMGLALTPATLSYIRDYTERAFGTYACLCIHCLNELKTEASLVGK